MFFHLVVLHFILPPDYYGQNVIETFDTTVSNKMKPNYVVFAEYGGLSTPLEEFSKGQLS